MISLFPEYFSPLTQLGIVGKLFQGERGEESVSLELIQLRDFATNKYKSVDDEPFGGGGGMIMRADILENALMKGIMEKRGLLPTLDNIKKHLHIIFPSPRGKVWNYQGCKELAQQMKELRSLDKEIVFICGRYEGVDERFIETYVDEEISLGDFILSGGELATMVILDSALRFLPGTLGNKTGAYEESFEEDLLECPQYTRPRVFQGKEVPDILLSGHHAKIKSYQLQERIRITAQWRPDLKDRYEQKMLLQQQQNKKDKKKG